MGWQERLETGSRSHVHARTDVEVSMHKEGETAQKAAPGTGGGRRAQVDHRFDIWHDLVQDKAN